MRAQIGMRGQTDRRASDTRRSTCANAGTHTEADQCEYQHLHNESPGDNQVLKKGGH